MAAQLAQALQLRSLLQRPLGVAAVAICGLMGCRLATEPLPPSAESFEAPAVYARWWALTEACSGRTGDLAAIHWFQVPGRWDFPTSDGREVSGYTEWRRDRIVLAGDLVYDGATVRHEMLHALLRQSGHPDAQFRGSCAGLVGLPGTPWFLPTEDYAHLPPDSLVVAIDAELLPRETDGERWLSALVTVRNSRGRAALVAAPGDAVTPRSFGYLLRGPSGGYQGGVVATDSSVLFFEPFETKRWLFEFRVGTATALGFVGIDSIGPGTYQVQGDYATRWSVPATVEVSP